MKERNANKLTHVRKDQIAFYLIAFLSLSVLAALAVTTQQRSMETQKTLIAAVFGAICLLGIVAGTSPSRCNRLVRHIPMEKASFGGQKETLREKANESFKGHHPTCGNFSSHILQVGGQTYCAGCTGLVIGATMALIGTIFYIFLQNLSSQSVTAAFWLGLIGTALGVLQYNLFTERASIHLLLNMIFVVGAFLLLVGVTEMNGGLSVGVYSLAVILFLIYVRSALSRLEHMKKCTACNVECCSSR